MRATPEDYERLELRAHTLLADVPLHDVWAIDLPGGGPGLDILDLRELLSLENLREVNLPVRLLFGLRGLLGGLFGWDGEAREVPRESFLERLSPDDREQSLVEPGTTDGPFRVLFVSRREAISETRNATVHAFLVYALMEGSEGQRLYWAVHVQPVGRITGWYMRLIDPFRRWIVYPAILRHVLARTRDAHSRGVTSSGDRGGSSGRR